MLYFCQGFFMLLFAILFFGLSEEGLLIVLLIIGIGMSLRGLKSFYYYLTMARHMVGGKRTLYRAILFLDLGVFTFALADHPAVTVVTYITIINAFAGLVGILRAFEAKKLSAPQWKSKMLDGVVLLVLSLVVVVYGFFKGHMQIVIYTYALGLVISASHKIISAFRKTTIPYIA